MTRIEDLPPAKAKAERLISLSLPPSRWGREKKMGSRAQKTNPIPLGIDSLSDPDPTLDLDLITKNKEGG
jgi:hypothetical protein